VAIKVLPPVHAKEAGFSQRFAREAKAIANLHHRNILPVYDFGQDQGYSFIVMRYIPGAVTLKEFMSQPLSMAQVTALVQQIAAALQHAHDQGIVHRDVKPANVLMDGDWALLSDFGLAKMTEASVKLTGSGVGVGTPAYMSPEQGQGLEVDHRTDVYGLGIILFEMLTGVIPHQADTPFAIVLKRVTEPLPLPRVINPAIPEAVEEVILKALAPDPAHRFQSAERMAEALGKASHTAEAGLILERAEEVPEAEAVEDEGLRTRPIPGLASQVEGLGAEKERGGRTAVGPRRQVPIWAWLALGAAPVLAIALAWILLSDRNADTVLTSTPIAAGSFTPAQGTAIAPTSTPTPAPTPIFTPSVTHSPTPIPATVTPTLVPLALSKTIISPDNVADLAELAQIGQGRAGGRSLAFSPDGWMLAAPEGNTVNLWRVSDGALLQTLSGHELAIGSLAFSPDGAVLASAVTGQVAMENIRLSRVSDGTLLRSMLSYYVSTLVFSPDGEILAAGKRLGQVELWDVGRGRMQAELVGHTDQERGKSKDVRGLAFSPDGEILASSAYQAKLWRVSDGSVLRVLDAPGYVESLAFSPGGEILATGNGGSVQLWRVSECGGPSAGESPDTGCGELVFTLEGHADDVRSLGFSSSGELLASLSDDKTVRLWRVSDGTGLRTLEMTGFEGYMSGHKVGFSPDGTLLAFGGADGSIKLWGVVK
jgi:WD40 repeat protein